MKKLLQCCLTALVLMLSERSFAQENSLLPVTQETPVVFYNESGTAVTRIGSGDSLTTRAFNLAKWDEIAFSLATEGQNDSAHVQLFVMYGDGAGSGNGFYATGFETMSAVLDSIASNGLRNGPKTGMGYTVKKNRLNTTTHSPYRQEATDNSAMTDSVVTYTYATTGQNAWVKFVLVGETNDNQEVSNSDWLNNSIVTFRRYD